MVDTNAEDLRRLYLDLLRDAVRHVLYRPIDAHPLPEHVVAFHEATGLDRAITGSGDLPPTALQLREFGMDNPIYAQTLVTDSRLDNARRCIEAVLHDGVPGDIIEAGVWRGGTSIFMRGVLKAHGITDRQVVLADSFEGLPVPDVDRYPDDGAFSEAEVGRFAAGLDEVRQNLALYGMLDDQIEFVEGWFEDSLPGLRNRTWAVLRLDGDLYQSTMDCLENLYDGLSQGGFVIIDDYVLPPCQKAVHEFRERRGITDEIVSIDWAAAFWRRT